MSYHHPIVPAPQIRTLHCFQHISFTALHLQTTQMLMKSCRITVLLKPGSEWACDSFFIQGSCQRIDWSTEALDFHTLCVLISQQSVIQLLVATADSILVLSSVTEWWWGRWDGRQDEAHAGVHPKPSVQRLQSLQRAVWGELINQSLNIYISQRVCAAHCFLNQWRSNPSRHLDRKQPCVTHNRLCCFSEKLNQFIKSNQQIHEFEYQNTGF